MASLDRCATPFSAVSSDSDVDGMTPSDLTSGLQSSTPSIDLKTRTIVIDLIFDSRKMRELFLCSSKGVLNENHKVTKLIPTCWTECAAVRIVSSLERKTMGPMLTHLFTLFPDLGEQFYITLNQKAH